MKKTMKKMMALSLVFVFLLCLVLPVMKADAADYKSLYARFIRESLFKDDFEERVDGLNGSFIYINNDDIPELYITGLPRAEGEFILTMFQGRVRAIHIGSYTDFLYAEKKNIVYYFGKVGNGDIEMDIVFTIRRGRKKNLFTGEYRRIFERIAGVSKEFMDEYNINNKRVSVYEYTSSLKSRLNDTKYKYSSPKLQSFYELGLVK